MSRLVPVPPRPSKKWGLCPTNSGFVHASCFTFFSLLVSSLSVELFQHTNQFLLVSHTNKQPCCFTFFRLLVLSVSVETFQTTIQFLFVLHTHKVPSCFTFFRLLVPTLSVESFQPTNQFLIDSHTPTNNHVALLSSAY